MSAHAFFPPSGAAETVACAMWPTMNALYPQPATDDSREGEAAHWGFAELYHSRPIDVGQIAPNGVMLTEEIIESSEAMASALHGAEWTVERPVGNQNSLNWGTPDARRLEPAWLRIKDLKHGHKPVDAFEWWQGINYAKLLVETYGIVDSIEVEFEIVQPRVYRRRDRNIWLTSVGALRPYFQQLDEAHVAAVMPNPTATAGPQCEYCPGRHACLELQRSSLTIAQHSGDGTPFELTDEALGREAVTLRRARALLDARLTGLEVDIEARMRRGLRVPHHRLVQGESRETWTLPAEQIIAIGAALDLKLGAPKAVTPNQARKAGMDPAVVASMSHRPPAAMKVIEDDGRAAAKVFDGFVNMS